jgi:hypothetical protein
VASKKMKMDYYKLLAITGTSGLFELVKTRNDGTIVKSLEDNSVKFITARGNTFTHLETIEIFTTRDNVNLIEVFHAMEKSELPLPSDKDPKALKSYFTVVFPDMDFDRVYASDMKKMVKWFAILKAHNITIILKSHGEEEVEEETSENEAVGE